MAMDFSAVMKALRARGKPNTAVIYRRHGVREETFGVSYVDVGALTKKIGLDHELALALWKSGNHDARVLATKIADPARATPALVQAWLTDADNYVITDALSGLAARMPAAADLARRWTQGDGEWETTSRRSPPARG